MTNSYVQVPPDSTGKKLYTQQHTVGSDTVQGQVMHLASPDDPTHIQKVDTRGQAYTRFAEGSPTMDAFGGMRVSDAHILGGYEYSQADQSGLFQDATATGGTITWAPGSAKTVMTVTGTSGSSTIRTTNRWHFYQPGVGNHVIITASLSDEGKSGNTRRWGYFDEDDGLFFELQGTTLNVVLRSSTLGTELRVPQSSWNGDKLDGTGISQMDINLTKANFFWIDYAWLGVGTVRFGVLAADGSRWVCHTFENPNNHAVAYMRTGSLPLRYENFNTSVTAGASSMNLICGAVYTESKTDYVYWRFSDIETPAPVEVSTNTHLISMRPKLEASPGFTNRTGIYPDQLDLFVSGGNVKITILDEATLTGASWQDATSLAQYDVTATVSGGEKFRTYYLAPGVHSLDLSKVYETNDEGYHVLADGTSAYTFTVVATKLDGTTVNVAATLGYRELN